MPAEAGDITRFAEGLIGAEISWSQMKTFVEHSAGFSNDALHVLLGCTVQILMAAIFRTSVASLRPWIVVFVLAIANEVYDLRTETWPDLWMQWGEGVKDVVLTMALPTLLSILVRYAPGLFGAGSRAAAAE
jgi:hypothetical protein